MDKQGIVDIIKDSKVIIFDFDGTVVDLNVNWSGLKGELKNHFLDILGININFTPLHQNIKYITNKFGMWAKEDAYKILKEYEFKSIEYSVPNLKTVNLIKRVYGHKKLAIFSDNSHETVIRTLKKFNIQNFFEFVVGFEDVENPKPQTDGLNTILQYFEVNPSEILFIGDSWKDFECGKNLKVLTVDINAINEKSINLIVDSCRLYKF